MTFDLATVGDNCIDRYLAPLGLTTVGGNAVNVAVHLGALGHRVAYVGAVGDDAAGRRTLATLADRGVATDRVRALPGRHTATTDIQPGPRGERRIVHEDFGACRGYRPNADDRAWLRRMRHVHIGWLDDGGALRRTLAGQGVSLSQDLSVNAAADSLGADGLAVAFAATQAPEAEAVLARILAGGATLAVVTCGEAGSLAGDGRTLARTGVAPAAVIDTLGAGDTFIARFLDARLRGCDLQACLDAARDAAAVTCGHLGGFPQGPERLEGWIEG